MASKGGNFFNELLTDLEEEQTVHKEKAQEKQRKIAAAAAGKKQDKSKTANSPEKSKKHVAEIDTSRPQKRAFDRQSGTGRGKEVSKGGHLGAGKLIEPQEVQEATEEVLDGKKPEIALPPTDETAEKAKKEEKKEQPKQPKAPKNQTLSQYTQQMESMKIMLEQRQNAKPNEMESEVNIKDFKILNKARPESQNLNETIPVPKPKKQPAQKPQQPAKTEPKKDAKKEQKKEAPKKDQKKEAPKKGAKQEPKKDAKKGAKDDKKGGKKEAPKKQAAPAPAPAPKKVEKPQIRMTTADFFKGVQPVSEPRRRPPREQRPPREERREERRERPAATEAATTYQRWTPSGGIETIVEKAAPVEATQESRPAPENRPRKGPNTRMFSSESAFPTLGKSAKNQQAKKEAKAAAKPAAN